MSVLPSLFRCRALPVLYRCGAGVTVEPLNRATVVR